MHSHCSAMNARPPAAQQSGRLCAGYDNNICCKRFHSDCCSLVGWSNFALLVWSVHWSDVTYFCLRNTGRGKISCPPVVMCGQRIGDNRPSSSALELCWLHLRGCDGIRSCDVYALTVLADYGEGSHCRFCSSRRLSPDHTQGPVLCTARRTTGHDGVAQSVSIS